MIETMHHECESNPEISAESFKIIRILGYVSANQEIAIPVREPDQFMISKPA